MKITIERGRGSYNSRHDYHHHYERRDRMPRRYGCLSFIGDLFMIVITGGLWLIWIFCREMRKR